jgi:hypothetical protein
VSTKKIRRDAAANALRTLTPDKAFHFYREIGQPLGVTAKNLREFALVVKGIDPSSAKFHVERGDFEGWFKMLGDKSLTDQVVALRGENLSTEELRMKLGSAVELRVDQLQRIAEPRR